LTNPAPPPNHRKFPAPTERVDDLEGIILHAQALVSILELPFLTDVEIDECHTRAIEIYNGVQRIMENGEE
jgi:hypothetical protein